MLIPELTHRGGPNGILKIRPIGILFQLAVLSIAVWQGPGTESLPDLPHVISKTKHSACAGICDSGWYGGALVLDGGDKEFLKVPDPPYQ